MVSRSVRGYKSRNVNGAHQWEMPKWFVEKITPLHSFPLHIYRCSATKQGTAPSNARGRAAMLPMHMMNMYGLIIVAEGVAEKFNDDQ